MLFRIAQGGSLLAVSRKAVQKFHISKLLVKHACYFTCKKRSFIYQVMLQEENYRKVEKASRSLLEDKTLLMNQMQKKSDQVAGLKKEIDNLTFELQRSKENHSKKIGECETLQQGRQELRNLNERLRKTLGDVSKTCESNEQNMLSFKLELEKSEIAIEQHRRENEQLNAVNMRLRDEIKGMQESAHEMQRLVDELKDSQHVNKALQKQLNEISQSKSSLQPDVDKLRGQVTELQRSNSAFEEKMRFYERQASALQAEYREEKSTFERGKDSLRNEIEALKKEVGDLNRVKTDLESKVKGLFYESESYKSMIERLALPLCRFEHFRFACKQIVFLGLQSFAKWLIVDIMTIKNYCHLLKTP